MYRATICHNIVYTSNDCIYSRAHIRTHMAPLTVNLTSSSYNLEMEINGKQRAFTLPGDLIQNAHGKVWLRLLKGHSSLRRILTVQSTDDSRSAVMAVLNKSDSIERLTEAKNVAMYNRIAGERAVDNPLGGVRMVTRVFQRRSYQAAIGDLPDSIVVNMDPMDDVPGAAIEVLTERRELWIHLTAGSMTWLTESVVASAVAERNKPSKRGRQVTHQSDGQFMQGAPSEMAETTEMMTDIMEATEATSAPGSPAEMIEMPEMAEQSEIPALASAAEQQSSGVSSGHVAPGAAETSSSSKKRTILDMLVR